jgi:copper resistance protein C
MRIIAGTLCLLLFGTITALAHADLTKTSPSAGVTVSEAPQEVVLTFTERLEAAFSRVTVTDAAGAEVNQGKPEVAGNIIRVSLKRLSGGTYKVDWRAVTPDAHRVDGSFTFRVDAPKSN